MFPLIMCLALRYYPQAWEYCGYLRRLSVLATISSYTISTITLKLTHMVAMSICATLHYLEF